MSEARYGPMADRAAREAGVPVELYRRLIAAESGWRPDATSSAGARGLVQLMPGTARGLGVSDPTDPAQALPAGARYLRQQFDKFGRWDYALAAYNAGPGAVTKHGGIPPYPETRAYVPKVLGDLNPRTGVARVSAGGIMRPLPTAMPKGSTFRIADGPEGVRASGGGHIHGGLDWFAPAGTTVYAPTAGRAIEVKTGGGTSGQVFGGVVKVQAGDGKVYTFRHVDPAVKEGATVAAGSPIAKVGKWEGGAPHAHIEVWKSASGSYVESNMLDPFDLFSDAGPVDRDLSVPEAIAGGADEVAGAISNPVSAAVDRVLGWITERAALVLAYLVLAVLAIWLLGTGSSRAFGTPAPSSLLPGRNATA